MQTLLHGLPSGVAVDSKGRIRIVFASKDITYTIPAEEVNYLDQFHIIGYKFPGARPPVLLSVSESSIDLGWAEALPYSVGIIFSVEIQYLAVRNTNGASTDVGNNLSSRHSIRADKGDNEDRQEHWSSLVTKSYSERNFFEYHMDHLRPGKCYSFRLRYRCPAGWSEYSGSTDYVFTRASSPAPPAAPVCSALMAFAAEIFWKAPAADNGSSVIEYILEGKSVGDHFQIMYRGPLTQYLAIGLFPEYAYSFRVAAVNQIGVSEFSKTLSFQTPSLAALAALTSVGRDRDNGSDHVLHVPGFTGKQVAMAIQCLQAWREHWDPMTEQPFYFNSILAIRQLEMPEVLRRHQQVATSSNSPMSNRENITDKSEELDDDTFIRVFRKKRYRLVRSLHNRKRNVLNLRGAQPQMQSHLLSTSNEAAMSTTPAPSSSVRPDCLLLRLRREFLLQDFAAQVLPFCPSSSSPSVGHNIPELLKRIKVQFVGEEGIDAGGLGKEAFLLLSRDIARYGLQRGFLRSLQDSSSSLLSPKATKQDTGGLVDTEDQKESLEAPSKMVLETSKLSLRSLIGRSRGGLFFNGEDETNGLPPFTNNKSSSVDDSFGSVDLSAREFGFVLGIFLGKSVMDRQMIEFPASFLLLEHLLGTYDSLMQQKMVSAVMTVDKTLLQKLMEDILRPLDATLYNSMTWMLNNTVENVLDETFSVTITLPNQKSKVVPLCARGEDTAVTDSNKAAYIYLSILWKFVYAVADVLPPCRDAFHCIVPPSSLADAAIKVDELYLMLNGKEHIDIEELRAYVVYQGVSSGSSSSSSAAANSFHECCASVIWLWRCVRDMSDQDRRAFLLFFTGSSRVPLDGYDPPLTITDGADRDIDSLPRAHTCFNQLVLPRYSNLETMRSKILFAIHNTAGFGLA